MYITLPAHVHQPLVTGGKYIRLLVRHKANIVELEVSVGA